MGVWYIPESSNRSAPFYHNALILQTMMRKSMFAMLSASVRVLSAWKDLKRGAHQIHYGILEELQGMRWLQGTTRNWTRLSPITHRLAVIGPTETHKGRQGETWEPMTRNDSRWLKINVVSWLVARFAINFGHTCFFFEQNQSDWVKQILTFFLEKVVLVCLSQMNQSAYL